MTQSYYRGGSEMKVTFRDIDFASDADCALLAVWFNQDTSALSLSGPEKKDTAESIRKTYLKAERPAGSGAFFLCVNDEPIGYSSYLFNPRHKLSTENVLWPSLAIGVHHYRRRGFVYKIGEELARRAKKLGATHLEAGVFTSNAPMIALLRKYGFTEIGRQIVGPARIDSIHFLRPLPGTSPGP